MMLVVDHDQCQGHGKCYLLAPALFEPDDDWGRPRVIRSSIGTGDDEHLELARLAISNCPERAIRLEPDGAPS